MIDQYPPANGVLTSLIWRKTMSGGETSLSGYDNASQALSYTPGQEQVYLNGILLVRGDDYTATNGTSITGLTALSALDFVQINCYNNFSVASVPTTSLTGEVTNSQITSLATSKLTGTVTNAQLAGSISNDKLSNSSITINGSAVALGGSATIAGGSAQDDAPASPTEGQLWLDTNGTLATTAFTEKSTLTTTGDIYYASAANTPARLGIGSSGQVLTVASGIPSWATASSGALVLVTRAAFSGVATTTTTFDNVFTTTYKNYQIVIEDIESTTNNAFLYFQYRYAGPTTQATSYYGSVTNFDHNGTTTNTQQSNASQISMMKIGSSGSSTNGQVGNYYVSKVGASGKPAITGQGAGNATTGAFNLGVTQDTTRTYTGFILSASAGNITGTVAVYGLATA